RANRARAPVAVGERVELVPAHGVLVRDLVQIRVRHPVGGGDAVQLFWRVRPRRVRVGIVLLPADVVDADLVPQLDADRVGDEAREVVLGELGARTRVT